MPALPVQVPLRAWKSAQTQSFTTRRDIRDLLVVEHPWVPSHRGGAGQWTARISPPPEWRPGRALFVSFYQFDNYSAFAHPNKFLGEQIFLGHRFKQLLVNDQLVWEQDVADEEFAGRPDDLLNTSAGEPAYNDPYRVVDISAHARPGMSLTFRVFDKAASTTVLPGDSYRRFSWSVCDPAQARQNFYTTCYAGDFHLLTQRQAVRPQRPALPARAPKSAKARVPRGGIPLMVDGPEEIPAPGYPVRSGVPFPRGLLRPGTGFALRGPDGRGLPLVTTETSHWPDGSIRWLLCEFVAQAGKRGARYHLVPRGRAASPKSPVRVRTSRSQVTISNGAVTLALLRRAGPGVWEKITCPGGTDLGAMDFSIKINRVGWRDHFTARRRRVVIEKATALYAIVRIEGDMLDAKRQRFGPFRARVQVWAGLPYLLVDWRLVNESDQAMAMFLDWSARVALPDLSGTMADFGPFEAGYDLEDIGQKAMGHRMDIKEPRRLELHRDSELSCRQERADHARIYRNTSWVATTQQAAGFVNLRRPAGGTVGGGVVGAMRWFAEEFPKGIIVRPDLLCLATLPESESAMAWPHDRPWVRMGRGEAKRQVFALWLHDGHLPARQAERFNACVQDAPRLFDQDWFIDSAALECGPPRDTPALKDWASVATPAIERTGLNAPRLGHREYWDTCWSNDYRGRTHAGLLQYVETADPRWFRYFDAACTHNRDVDTIHFCPEHPEWVGGVHAYGEDHTSCGPMGNIGLNCDGMLEHYLLTGDPDSLEAAHGLAGRLLTCDAWARVREIGWPLSQLSRWYDQTGDRRYKKRIDEFMAAARTYIEPRGGLLDEMHGSCNYRGAVPFMSGYLGFGLMRHHQLTGDPQTLRMLHALATGLFAEMQVDLGWFRYSPFPECNGNPGSERSRGFNGLVGGLAGYVYLATGDEQAGRWAMACYRAVVERSSDGNITLDMIHPAGWMLKAVAALQAKTR